MTLLHVSFVSDYGGGGLRFGVWEGRRCWRRQNKVEVGAMRRSIPWRCCQKTQEEEKEVRREIPSVWRTLWKQVSQPLVMTGPAKWAILGVLAAVIVGSASLLSVGVALTLETADGGKSLLARVREKVTLFDYILEDIAAGFVEEVDLDKLFDRGVNAMLAELDPYTQFENQSQTKDLSLLTSGRYGGVGLVISPDPTERNRIIVLQAFENYAWKAGVRPGDALLSVNGVNVKDLSTEQVSDLLRGPAGSTVSLRLEREGRKLPLETTVNREEIKMRDVSAYGMLGDPSDGIGYIRLQSFGANSAYDMHSAVRQLLSSQELRGLILDLRGNPGGLLNAAVETAELFVPRDAVIVSAKGRSLGFETVYRSSSEPVLPKSTRFVVLVNGNTASASEIVAGAVQDYDLGVILGSRTFGKGLIQNVEHLPFETALKFTVGRYYTPSGRCIQDKTYSSGESVAVKEADRKPFKTRAGRVVLDGGGVSPDVELTQPKPSELENALIEQGMFFYYANHYASVHPSLDGLAEISDETYLDFQNFVQHDKRFTYRTRFDEGIDSLQVALKNAGFQSASGEVQDVKNAVQVELKEEFRKNRKPIEDRLIETIQSRYVPDTERIMATLTRDAQVKKAVDIIRNPKYYSALLTPYSPSRQLGATNGVNGVSSLFPPDQFRLSD